MRAPQVYREEWRMIPGWEGAYQASTLGRVRSIRFTQVRYLKPNRQSTGYYTVALSRVKAKHCLVHRLILETFVGPAPSGMNCAHLNGRKDDNRLANLKWVTFSENESHKSAHGTKTQGERHHNAKLSEADARLITKMGRRGAKSVQEKLGISKATYYRIKNGVSWEHLKDK